MNLLAPSWLLLGLLALPILLLYMLKLHRREVTVSSTLLWLAALRDRQANTPWQRLRRNLLLFLQLLILAGLTLALSRPALMVRSVATGSLVVILDASASMAAADVSPTRFEAARQVARRLIQELGSQSRMTLILASRHPAVLAAGESDKTRLHSALDSAQQTHGSADWKTTFALAAGAASSTPAGQQVTILILSDGGLPDQGLPPLPGEVRFVPIGSASDNLAVSALALRKAPAGSELFARVNNYGPQARQAVLSFYRNGQLFSARQIEVPAKGEVTFSLEDLPADQSLYRAALSPADAAEKQLDFLDLDNSADAVSQPISQGSVLLVTRGNFFLEQALAAIPSISPYRALATPSPLEEGDIFPLPNEPFDLYVLDGILPTNPKTGLPILPDGNLLLINPPPTTLFTVTGVFSDTASLRPSDHPLMQYVDWSAVHVAQARIIQPPEWAEMLVSAAGKPLVFAGETGNRRVAVIAFDLHDSDLPLQIAFPVLMSNLVNYLAPSQSVQAVDSLQPGEAVSILPGAGIQQVAIVTPLQHIYTLTPGEDALQFNQTDAPGIYSVNLLAEESQKVEFFAVNLFDEAESDITPKAAIQVGRKAVMAAQEQKLAQRELWEWLAALALLILGVEWWVYHRRQSVASLWRR